MNNLAHEYQNNVPADFELRVYKEKRRRQREQAYKGYIRKQRIWGAALIVVSILSFPVHEEMMVLVFCVLLGIMPWIPEKGRR